MSIWMKPISIRDARYFLSCAELMLVCFMIENRGAPSFIASNIRAMISKSLLYFLRRLENLEVLYFSNMGEQHGLNCST